MLQSNKTKIKARQFILFFNVLVFIWVSQTSVVDIHILLYVAILIRLIIGFSQLIKFIYNNKLWAKHNVVCIVSGLVIKIKKNNFLIFLPLLLL